MRVLLVGGGAREHAIAATLARSGAEVVAVCPHANPGIAQVASEMRVMDVTKPGPVAERARAWSVAYAVIGPEAPLAAGVADAIRALEVPVVGPSKDAARIESSKEFCRQLLDRHGVPGAPKFASAHTAEEVDRHVPEFAGPFVVKPIGLTSGKGVWVQGRDFPTAEEGAAYAKRVIAGGGEGVVLEERMEGEEFSLMAFVTDSGVYPMPVVQDFKRALEGDGGPNTGGMGSYSQRDHLLPFLPRAEYDRAVDIMRRAVAALTSEGLAYRGILYGGFMLTSDGPRLVEFNARFGDPEALNVLSLYEEGNFGQLLEGVARGRVDPNLVRFRLRASVVKYLVPPGYPQASKSGGLLELDEPAIEAKGVRVLFGQVEAAGPGRFTMGTSRAIALVGEASAIHEAGARVEAALASVRGEYGLRHDIGSKADLAQRTERMRRLYSPGAKASPLPLSVAPPDAPPSSAAGPSQVM
jgi:phosphoribosylamine--glycine ligase